jgi:hypothetical protein
MLFKVPFSRLSLTYFLIRLKSNAKTDSSSRYNFVFRRYAHPFWGHLLTSILFQTIEFAKAAASPSSISSTQQSIHHRRGDTGIDLSHLIRPRKDRNFPSPQTQWRLPIPHGTTHLSQSHHIKTIPSSDGSFSTPQIEEPPRQTPFVNDPKTEPSHQGDLRSGFHRPYPLWQTGDGSDRLQSPEMGPPFLSSTALFQWDHQGFLAWRASPWRYPYGYWNRGTSEGSLCQITSLCEDRNYSSRQGFLRPRDHRISGVQQSSFCYCGQAYRSGQKDNLNPILSASFLWTGDRGIHVSTHKVEKAISLCGGQAPHPRRPYGTTYPLLNGQIQLSGYCDQYEIDPSPYLEILQWPGRRRTYYQRTQRGLSSWKNSHKTFRSQRGLLPHPLILLQSHQLVQTTLLTNGVSPYDA